MREQLTIYVYGNIIRSVQPHELAEEASGPDCDRETGALAEMDLIQIYQCFRDRTRLRILHLLTQEALCHLQEILSEPQVKISKHLANLRARRMVWAERSGSWMIYSLPVKPEMELKSNLKCLQDCVQTDPEYKKDLRKLAELRTNACELTGMLIGNEATGV
jgi:ArsR family transcriptional regulator